MPSRPVNLPMPVLASGGGPLAASVPAPLRLVLSWQGREVTVWMVDVGLACCSLEVMAAALATRTAREAGRLEPEEGAVPDVLVVSGTCTHAMAPAVRRLWESLPGPPRVVSFGACANTGGPYWDSYAVAPGIDDLLPVDVHVPGCPPPPEALLEAMVVLEGLPS